MSHTRNVEMKSVAVVRLITFVTLALVAVRPSAAQAAETPAEERARGNAAPPARSTTAVQAAQPDFLFGRPRGSIGLRGLFVLARAESEIFDFVGDRLTLEKSHFNAPGIAIDVGISLDSLLDVVAGFEYSRASAFSNYRELVDANDLEIEQTTSLSQVNLSGSLELALLPRGRAIGQYVYVPAAVTPYVGAGGGLLWHRFEQEGDFVDELDEDMLTFTARLRSSGWTPAAHVFAGVDVRVARRVLLTGEARYQWADAQMNGSYIGFEPIDLTGLRVSGGVQFVF